VRLNNKIIAWIQGDGSKTSLANQGIRKLRGAEAQMESEQLTSLFAYHFSDLGTMQAQSTFTAIQQALMTEIELNPNALSRMEDLYSHVIKELDYTAFMVDPSHQDPNDERQARQKFDVLIGNYGGVIDKQGRSSLMSSFLALAMTSDQFREILRGMEKPKAEKSDDTGLDALIENTANGVMDQLSMRIAGENNSDANVRDALDRLMYVMIENVGDQRSFIEQRTENGLDKFDGYIANAIQTNSANM
jgi:hypothetical protein